MGLQDFLARLFGASSPSLTSRPVQSEPAEVRVVEPTTEEQWAQMEIDRLIRSLPSDRGLRLEKDKEKDPVPFQVTKARQAMQYIIRQCSECFSTKLVTCLWRADCCAYNELGRPITGLAYRMTENGLMPVGFDILSKLPFFCVVEKVYQGGHVGKVYQLTSIWAENPLSRREVEILTMEARRLDPMNASELNTQRRLAAADIQDWFCF